MPTGRELRRLVAETGPDGVHPNRGWVYDGQRAQYVLNDLRDLDFVCAEFGRGQLSGGFGQGSRQRTTSHTLRCTPVGSGGSFRYAVIM